MRAKAIIYLDRFSKNIAFVKERTDRSICVPVKADGYGHGAPEIAKTALDAGAFCVGIATADEGAELRKDGIFCPILLFSQAHPAEIPRLIEANLTPFVSDSLYADALNEHAAAKNTRLQVHLKIDTGMGRLGCRGDTSCEALSLAKHIAACPALELAGVATHFAVADSAENKDRDYTIMQIDRFKNAVQAIRDAGINPGIVHAANSGAVLQYPEAWFDMVRPGILLYGYVTAENAEFSSKIKPVMELRTVVSLIKKVKKGESVSYGRKWTASYDTNIAVLSIGYGDGLPRLASNKWKVQINGKTYPIAGTICMDQCCIDLGQDGENGTVKLWDEAVIFGGTVSDAAELAKAVGTIPYEITCNINKRVNRQFTSPTGS